MPRLGLGIHDFGATGKKLVDPKAKPWDDVSKRRPYP
jgi:hypothetical protein